MSEEILINVTPRETRVAVVENGMLQELHIERASRRGVVGNIYKGRVQRVMPGMQAAFVEIGLDRAAFLHASDILKLPLVPTGEGEEPPPAPTGPPPSINSLVQEGQEIVVQVVKDPIGGKGARLTTQISIPSRYLVFLPHSRVLGVSARIEDETERARLKALMATLANGSGQGYIVRTNAEGQPDEALAEDVAYLRRAWDVDQGLQRQQQGRPAHLRRPVAAAARGARPDAQGSRAGAGGFARGLRPAHRVRRTSSCRRWPSASNTTPASGPSSTCTASRTRSCARCRSRCRSSPAAT